MKNIIPFIFASGLGTRLRPLTNSTPKPLLGVKKELTILDFVLNELVTQNFNQVFINYSYRKDLYEELVKRHPKIKINLVDDQKILGQGGILLKEKFKLKPFDFILAINGDSIIKGALPSFLNCAQENMLCLLSNNKYPVTRNLICDKDGFVYGVNPRPNFTSEYWYKKIKTEPFHNNYLGYLLVPTELLKKVKYNNGFMSIFRQGEIIDQLIKSGIKVKTCHRDLELFLSVNTERELHAMQKALQ